MHFLRPFFAAVFCLLLADARLQAQPPQKPLSDSLLPSAPAGLRWKVVYSRVDRGANQYPAFETRISGSPGTDTFSASRAFLPMAQWVLEKYSHENAGKYGLNSIMITESDADYQMPAYNDPRWPDGRPTLERYLKNMILLRDGNSFDRLFEYAGRDYLMSVASERQLDIHYVRRQKDTSESEAGHSNPVNFYNEKTKIIASLPAGRSSKPIPVFSGESKPVFSNLLKPESLHRFMIGLSFPQTLPSSQRALSAEHRNLLLRYASQWPEETTYPLYGREEARNAFFEAFFPDDTTVRTFSTGGEEGWQLLESAYVIDTAHSVEFFLTIAAEAADAKGLESAYGFMEDCAKRIMDYERKRPRTVKPDLSGFYFSYDK